MKVIDLYNKIANDEKLPKKIKYKNCIFENRFVVDYWCKETETCLDRLILMQNLNDEVEIVEEKKEKNFTGWKVYQDGIEVFSVEHSAEEEKKIPEKLIPTSLKGIDNLDEKIEIAHIDTISVIDTVNEIIDYLNNKGDE